MGDLHTRNGAQRFTCECGAKGSRIELGFYHTVLGHQVMPEVFSMGVWRNDGKSCADLLFEARMAKGEHPDVTYDRLKRLAEHWEQQLADARN